MRRPWLIGWLSCLVPPRLSLEIDPRRRSRATGYKPIKNLISKTARPERAGRMRIERIEKNYIGSNPINPATAIVWRRA